LWLPCRSGATAALARFGSAAKAATLCAQDGSGEIEVSKPKGPDFDETRAGFRSGEGADSVLRHLMAAARRRQRNKSGFSDSGPSQPPQDGEGGVDIPLPP
jgi:hypothetical protein